MTDSLLEQKVFELIKFANKHNIKICGVAVPMESSENSKFLIYDNASLIGSVQNEPLSNICMLIGNHGNINSFLLNKVKIKDQHKKSFSSYPEVSKLFH